MATTNTTVTTAVPTAAPVAVTVPEGSPVGALESPTPRGSLSISPVAVGSAERTPSMTAPTVLTPNEVLLTPAQTPAMTRTTLVNTRGKPLEDHVVSSSPEDLLDDNTQQDGNKGTTPPVTLRGSDNDDPKNRTNGMTGGTKASIAFAAVLLLILLAYCTFRERTASKNSSSHSGRSGKKKKKKKKKKSQKDKDKDKDKDSMFTNLAPGAAMS